MHIDTLQRKCHCAAWQQGKGRKMEEENWIGKGLKCTGATDPKI